MFIDFEYCCYNYRAFDIGDYLSESQFYYMTNPTYLYYEPGVVPYDVINDFLKVYSLVYLFGDIPEN